MINSILGFIGQAVEGAQSAHADAEHRRKQQEEARKLEEQKAREEQARKGK